MKNAGCPHISHSHSVYRAGVGVGAGSGLGSKSESESESWLRWTSNVFNFQIKDTLNEMKFITATEHGAYN